MQFSLSGRQYVIFTPSVCFQQYRSGGRREEIHLSYNQFQKLNDFIHNSNFPSFNRYSLGGGLWVHHRNSLISIIDYNTTVSFQFYPYSWQDYCRTVHPQLESLISYGDSDYYQSYAKHARREWLQQEQSFPSKFDSHARIERSRSPRGCSQHLSKRKQTLHRSPRNVALENEQPAKCASLPRRFSPNSGSHHRRRGGRDAARIRLEIEEGEVDAKLASDLYDNLEPSHPVTTEERDCSPEYSLE